MQQINTNHTDTGKEEKSKIEYKNTLCVLLSLLHVLYSNVPDQDDDTAHGFVSAMHLHLMKETVYMR